MYYVGLLDPVASFRQSLARGVVPTVAPAPPTPTRAPIITAARAAVAPEPDMVMIAPDEAPSPLFVEPRAPTVTPEPVAIMPPEKKPFPWGWIAGAALSVYLLKKWGKI